MFNKIIFDENIMRYCKPCQKEHVWSKNHWYHQLKQGMHKYTCKIQKSIADKKKHAKNRDKFLIKMRNRYQKTLSDEKLQLLNLKREAKKNNEKYCCYCQASYALTNEHWFFYLGKVKNCKIQHKDYNIKNNIQTLEYRQRYERTPKRRQSRNKREKLQYINNINFKLYHLLKNRMLQAFKKTKKSQKVLELTGLNLDDLKLYLESKFQPGMFWTNHTKQGWHIDHEIPCSAFDLSNIEHQKICFNYTNLQPMWASKNQSKQGINCEPSPGFYAKKIEEKKIAFKALGWL